jgi:Glycosyltransferase family 87
MVPIDRKALKLLGLFVVELSLRTGLRSDSHRVGGTQRTLPLAKPATRTYSDVWIVATALVALFLKLAIAYNTFGTNDVASFYMFALSLNDHGLEWTYRNGVVFLSNSPVFNHPPLVAYYLQLIESLSHLKAFRASGLTFPFLLRLPGIIADFVVVLVLMRLSATSTRFRIPSWALALFAISPVSLMVSGFHGNTDPVMVMFLVLSASMCLRRQPVLSGIFFALSCQVKVIPLLLLPILFFFWVARGATARFTIPFALVCLTMWAQPFLQFPALFFRNVFSYGGFWGGWGITYLLGLTRLSQFDWTGPFNLPWAADAVAFLLKAGIGVSVFAIAWRRRHSCQGAVIDSIAYAWIIFFVFSPAVSAQYMVWLAPFVLVLSPALYTGLVVSSSVFLFFFYNTVSGGLPWFIAISTDKLSVLNVWTPWSLFPWATLIVGTILLWKKAVAADPSLRLISLKTLRATPNE